MNINQLSREDIPSAIDLVWEVFDEFEMPDYSPEGTEEFRRTVNRDNITDMVNRGDMRLWGSRVEGGLSGVIAMRGSNHISLLFVRKQYHRQGIARRLFETVLDEIRKDTGIATITVNSSPYAVTVYHHLGFTDTAPEQTINGIRFTPMVYRIDR